VIYRRPWYDPQMSDPARRPTFGANLTKNITNRELNQARGILGVIGVIAIAVQVVSLSDLHQKVAALQAGGAPYDTALIRKLELIAYAGVAVGLAYLLCAYLVSRKPVFATVTGLTLFVGTIVAQAVVDPMQLVGLVGFGLRFVILLALISAVRFARIYERNRAELGDALDKGTPAERRHSQRALAMVAAAIVVAAVAVMLYLRSRGGAPGGKVRDRHDQPVELSALWSDRRALVLFYAGFDREREQLAEVNAHLAELDATVVAISFDSTSRMQQLHEELGLAFELYTDRTFQVIPKWGVPFVIANATSSATFVVEPGGEISHKQIGDHPPIAELIRLTLR
jgi:peroxiredoxin